MWRTRCREPPLNFRFVVAPSILDTIVHRTCPISLSTRASFRRPTLPRCCLSVFCILCTQNDALMARTRARPLPAGLISRPAAALFALSTGVAGVALLHEKTNELTAALGLANIALYAGIYTPLKVLHPGAHDPRLPAICPSSQHAWDAKIRIRNTVFSARRSDAPKSPPVPPPSASLPAPIQPPPTPLLQSTRG